ncbi:MAG: hypothetical protein HY360_06450 [Verrucomicrobia bacterium]|nr:hypothetical protein [Verrucomicrobiota bacterium]
MQETRRNLLVGGDMAMNELDGAKTFQRLLSRQVKHAHAALAQLAQQVVTPETSHAAILRAMTLQSNP